MSASLDAPRPAGLQFAGADQTRQPSALHQALVDRDAFNITLHDDGTVETDEPAEDEAPATRKPLYLRHDFGENLALHLTDIELNNLAAEIQRGIDSDKQDRRDWDETAARAVEYLGMKVMGETGASDVGGGALTKIWDPLILEATIKFWANAVAEFLPAAGPAKVRDDQPPPVQIAQQPGAGHNGGPPLEEAPDIAPPALNREDLAGAFEKDFNHYLTTGNRSYYRDFSRMLWNLGPIGTQFRKIYHCPLRGKPVSEWVKATNLIVSSDATDLSTAARVTQLIKMSQAQVRRLQRSGWWRDVPLITPDEEQTPYDKEVGEAEGIRRQNPETEDRQHTIQECYLELDLPGFEHTDDGEMSGMPLPYRVAMDLTSKQIVEIRRNWREDDENFQARQRYVMFGMIPGLGFYYLGFMHILGNAELTLTALARMLLDAGMFENFPGFLMGKGGGKQTTTDIMCNPGQAAEIDTGNKDIRQVVMPLPYKGPSQVLAALTSAMVDRFQKLAGAADIPVGEGTANVPVGTIVAMVEESTKVMAAVHKGLHASRAEELELLRELIAEDPSVLTRDNKNPARLWEQAEEFRDLDLVPSSDPNVPSQLHRIMQASALAQLALQAPGVLDPKWLMKDIGRTIGKEIPDDAFAPPQQGGPPPTDPAAMLKAQAAMTAAQTAAQKAQVDSQQQAQETQRKAAEALTQSENDRTTAQLQAQTATQKLQSQERIAGIQEQTERTRLAVETVKSAHEASMAERQHQSSQLGGIAGQQGVNP